MAFYFKNSKQVSSLVPLMPSDGVTRYTPTSSDIGALVVLSSNKGAVFSSTVQPDAGLGLVNGLFGIVQKVASTGSTHNSTVPFYVEPFRVGDIVIADLSTTYAGSTNFVVVTTNIGCYFKPCYSTGSTTVGTEALNAVRTEYINPSTAVNVPCSSECQIFKLIEFSTQNKQATFMIQTS